jgi:L-lactate dehydrogenase complex protein LldG
MQADVGITLCEALVARNGSVLVSNGSAAGRRLSIYPNIHIVLAYTSQLVMDLKDGFALLKEKYGDRLPSMISNVTGPSRTADIEKTLVIGAHGPKELFVFLIDG